PVPRPSSHSPPVPPHPDDHACTRSLPVVLSGRDEQADFEPSRALIEQGVDPLASRQLSLLVLAAHLVGPAALLEARFELAVFRGEGFKTTQGRWGSRRDMLGSPLFDVFHEVCRRGARSEQPTDPLLA